MIIKYISSQNKEYNLLDAKLRLRDGNFHNVAWKYSAISYQFGIKIQQFEKDPIKLELTFVVKGTDVTRKKILNDIHDSMEVDKINKIPGKIFWNDNYLKGYFIATNTYPAEDGSKTINETVFLAPYPFWITEQRVSISPISAATPVSEETGLKTYPYTYLYRYPLLQTETSAYIDHYTESDFQMTVYGPCASVLINIAGHPYEVAYPLEKGEYMVIDSRPFVEKEKRLYVVRANGSTENIFHHRSTEHSVFKKIPAGLVKIDYPRTHGVDLVIFKERSEPPWKSSH